MVKFDSNIDNVSLADVVKMMQREVVDQKHRIEVLENLLFAAKDVLTVEEAAKYLGLSKSFLYKMTHEGSIPYYKPNGKIVYFEKDILLQWMRSTKVSSKDEVLAQAQDKLQELSMK